MSGKKSKMKTLHINRKYNPAVTNHSCGSRSSRSLDLFLSLCASQTGPCAWVSVGVECTSEPM